MRLLMWSLRPMGLLQCNATRETNRVGYCTGGYPFERVKALPCTLPVGTVKVEDKEAQALVDSGCFATILASLLVKSLIGTCAIMIFDDRKVDCKGVSEVELLVGEKQVKVNAIVADKIIEGIDVVMGMDVIG
ncbi:hypothetical protein SK128_010310 [Halocaridina rubra]|uniref:Uncharacterized protein n=1 Tax=Halocaridina rubra TaxID=373956 RepID=A0AAN8WNS6_HALRR